MSSGLAAGSAYSIYRLDLAGFRQDIAEIKAAYQQLAGQGSIPLPAPRLPAPDAPTRTPRDSGGDEAAKLQREANAAIGLAQARARLALAEGDEARALGILQGAYQQQTAATERTRVGLQTQITQIQSGKTAFQQFGASVKDSLLGIVGPAAAAGLALGTAKKAIDSFAEAFK